MTRKYLFLIISVFILGCSNSLSTVQTVEDEEIFRSDDVEIYFPGGFSVSEEGEDIPDGSYFSDAAMTIRFCPAESQDSGSEDSLLYHAQSVGSPDGWLCNLTILPSITKHQAIEEVLLFFGNPESFDSLIQTDFLSEDDLNIDVVNDLPVISWRNQRGKTRLDHFLVLGDEHAYHFTSAPYGNGDEIELIIESMNMLN